LGAASMCRLLAGRLLLLVGLHGAASLRALSVLRNPARAPGVSMLLKPCWEDVGGCQVLRPDGKPRALLHFLGGVFVSPAPQVAYRYMLESLAQSGYLVVATPFAVDFDYRKPAAEVYEKFTAAQLLLVEEFGELPQLTAGHSLGALMQVLLCSLYPDYAAQTCASALISYNNKPASDAIPLFKEAFVPAFAPLEPLTRSQALLDARDQLRSLRRRSFAVAKNLAQVSPLTQLVMEESEVDAALRDGEVLASLADQIPDVFSQIARGASEFSPSPAEMRELVGRSYRQEKPLVISFDVDGLDESDVLEETLPPAIGATRARLPGTHLTPLAARRLLVPPALRPDFLLFDADGLVAEMDRYMTGALAELAVSEAPVPPEVPAGDEPAGDEPAVATDEEAQPAAAVEEVVEEQAEEQAFSMQGAAEAQAGERNAKSQLAEAARATAAAKGAEARAIVTAVSGLVVPVSDDTREVVQAEAAMAGEAARAAKREEERAGMSANIASVEARIAEIEALAERAKEE